MTKVISILIVVVVLFVGYRLYLKWEEAQNDEEITKKEAAAAVIHPGSLPGLPVQLETSYQIAASQGGTALHKWFKIYEHALQDPRKAWIQLDVCVAIHRNEPNEARRLFQLVKERTPANSPLQRRIKELEKTLN
jgi:hypothetical protein